MGADARTGHRKMPKEECPVCRAPSAPFHVAADGRNYRRCGCCAATFLRAAQLPAAAAEYAHYLLHNNDPANSGYRQFLEPLARPLLACLPPAQSGLDYGCGPGPALACMLREAGHDVALYDPFFHDDPGVLERTYDFVVCSEVVEHFHRPAEEFPRLDGLLKPGGRLGIMTGIMTDDDRFADWHYRRDPTHVVFYRPETFAHIARRHHWHLEFPAENVVLFRKDAQP